MIKETINNLAETFITASKKSETYTNIITEAENILPISSIMTGSEFFEKGLNSKFNSENELNSKKLLGVALLIAKKKGLLPEGIPSNIASFDTVTVVDEAFNKIKAGYQEAIGNIDVYEASDILIDKATARVVSISEKIIAKGIDIGINKIAFHIAKAFPPAIPVVICIKQFQPFLTQASQNLVRKGINALNEVAKKSVRKIGNVITNKIKATLKSLIKA